MEPTTLNTILSIALTALSAAFIVYCIILYLIFSGRVKKNREEYIKNLDKLGDSLNKLEIQNDANSEIVKLFSEISNLEPMRIPIRKTVVFADGEDKARIIDQVQKELLESIGEIILPYIKLEETDEKYRANRTKVSLEAVLWLFDKNLIEFREDMIKQLNQKIAEYIELREDTAKQLNQKIADYVEEHSHE